ncbi:hypothetical protein [Marinitoga sp. 1138]|uniref:hypothetical protein n=1 Tax=Marinitoga sp. 1138 TaxID=1643334 RepID=UPI001586D92B|nr:hypothetical protein [Marinitoga sp. 1138]NUU96895.1 hypothetical protein [Marinitoga sp. 1138]
MKKIVLIFFIAILNTILFSSAKLLFPGTIEYYYQKSLNMYAGIQYTGFPLLYKNDSEYKSSILFKIPLGYEKRLENTVIFDGGGYSTLEKDEIFFSDMYKEYYSWLDFGFEFYHNKNLYAQFIVDFKEGNSPYFKYKSMNIYDIYKDASILTRTTLDTPSLSYLSLNEKKWSMVLGRTPISLGPLKNSLLISDASKYYENINFKVKLPDITCNSILISMQPMMTKTEYEKQFSTDATLAFKEVWVNRIDYESYAINIGLSTLGLYGGEIPSTPFDVKNALAGIDIQYQKMPFRLYFQDAYNPIKQKNSYGYGVEILLKPLKELFISGQYEYYSVDAGIYEDDIPYNRLYNRSLEIINDPGARYFYDYPLGFKYDENSKATSISGYISSKNWLLYYENEFGISFGEEFKVQKIKGIINIPLIENLEFKYINMEYGDERYNIYSIFTTIPLKLK